MVDVANYRGVLGTLQGAGCVGNFIACVMNQPVSSNNRRRSALRG